MSPAVALGLAAAGAVLTVLAYPPASQGWLGFVAIAPLAAVADASRPRAAFGYAWLYSVAMALWIVRWLAVPLIGEYRVPATSAWAFVCLVVTAYALLPATACALYAGLRTRTRPLTAPLLFAALFVGFEWLRAEPLLLPWVLLGHLPLESPLWLQTADLFGAIGPGFVLATTGAALGVCAQRRSLVPLGAAFLVLGLAAGYGAWRLGGALPEGPTLRLGLVQASVPQGERFQRGSALRNTLRHMAHDEALLRETPVDLIVWSETSVDDDLDANPQLAEGLRRHVAKTRVPLITGAPRSLGGHRTNAVVWVGADGLGTSYDKQRLVPFSESDPELLAFLRPLLEGVDRGAAYVPGGEPVVFREAAIPFSVPICFEITDPHLVRGFRAAGAELLLNLSNDAWFGRTGYAPMHFGHAVLRAVELRSWVVRVANTGITAVVDPRGRVRARLEVFEEGTLVAEVGPAEKPSLYARLGSVPGLLLLATVAVAALFIGPRPGEGPGRS